MLPHNSVAENVSPDQFCKAIFSAIHCLDSLDATVSDPSSPLLSSLSDFSSFAPFIIKLLETRRTIHSPEQLEEPRNYGVNLLSSRLH